MSGHCGIDRAVIQYGKHFKQSQGRAKIIQSEDDISVLAAKKING